MPNETLLMFWEMAQNFIMNFILMKSEILTTKQGYSTVTDFAKFLG